jgi:hypothetical protein
MKQVLKLSWIGVLVLTVACVGLMGCGGDDDDSPSTITTVVTNVVNGVVVTNVVEVPAEPVADAGIDEDGDAAAEEAAIGPDGFLGVCVGKYENETGSSDIGATLELDGTVVSGVFSIPGNRRGFVTGTLNGFSLQMTMPVLNSDTWIRMQGQLSVSGFGFQGTWVDNFGNTGTCWLEGRQLL